MDGEKYTTLMLIERKQEQLYNFQKEQISKQGTLSVIRALDYDKGKI